MMAFLHGYKSFAHHQIYTVRLGHDTWASAPRFIIEWLILVLIEVLCKVPGWRAQARARGRPSAAAQQSSPSPSSPMGAQASSVGSDLSNDGSEGLSEGNELRAAAPQGSLPAPVSPRAAAASAQSERGGDLLAPGASAAPPRVAGEITGEPQQGRSNQPVQPSPARDVSPDTTRAADSGVAGSQQQPSAAPSRPEQGPAAELSGPEQGPAYVRPVFTAVTDAPHVDHQAIQRVLQDDMSEEYMQSSERKRVHKVSKHVYVSSYAHA